MLNTNPRFNPKTRIGKRPRPLRLGEWLIRQKVITREQLFWALAAHFKYGCRIGDAVIWLGFSERDRIEAEQEILFLRNP